MPRSLTTGIFTRTSNSFSEPVYGTVIDPTDANDTFDDFDAGMTFNNAQPVILIGSTSGILTMHAPAIAGTSVLTWPAGTTDFSATGGTGQYLKQNSAGGAFTVTTVSASEIASGAALTKTDDTNVTLTLGGTPTTALLAATSLTLGWTGTLSGTRGGTGVNNGANTITLGGNLLTAGAFTTAGAFGLTLTATNTTNSTLPAGSHTLAGLDVAQTWSALQQYNDGTFALKGSSSGTIMQKAAAAAGSNTLTWPAGTTDFSATGGASQVVKQTSAGGAFTVAQLNFSDIGSAAINTQLANMAAYTFKGNATGSSAAPQDFTIAGLTHKSSPATTDLLIISDEAASHATKYCTVAEAVGSVASGVTSIAGNTGAFTLSNGIANSTNDIRLSEIANLTALANISGASAIPTATTIREVLTADRTYYVRTDGSDSNNGLTNTSGGAWLTLQHAADWIGEHIDLGAYAITVQVGAGTYTAGLSVSRPFVGYNWVKFKGDETTPANVLISVGSGFAFQATHDGARFKLGGFKVANAGCAAGVYASAFGEVYIDGVMDFGAIATSGGTAHLVAGTAGNIIVGTNYNITGNAYAHHYANNGGVIEVATGTATLTGTPAFSGAFAFGYRNGTISLFGQSYSGSATGTRWFVDLGGGVDSGGTTLPGNGAGVTTSPGWKL